MPGEIYSPDQSNPGIDPQAEQKKNNNRKPSVIERVILIVVNSSLLLVVLILGFLLWDRFRPAQAGSPGVEEGILSSTAPASASPVTAEARSEIALEELDSAQTISVAGITRKPSLLTIIPSRPRVDVITYTVQMGDSLFSIADKFSLEPETILWGNYETLEDNPHLLSQGQVLNILPTNGTYYEWNEGDNLANVAGFFKVSPSDIISYPGNDLDLTQVSNGDPGIEPGAWVIIPGGKREIRDWGPPAITRSNPASASYYGPGHCGSVYSGAIGTGTFVWPSVARYLSGYDYTAIHPAIDIAGDTGNAIFATDNGVIVYAGWSNYGYGYLIVIDHGNGWQSAYAHLSAVAVTCGQSVYQGTYIGGLGSTGNSSGPHLHFELVFNGAKVNPWNYLQ